MPRHSRCRLAALQSESVDKSTPVGTSRPFRRSRVVAHRGIAMPSPQVLPPAPPEFHPEFGYLWPAAHTRRVVRVGLMSTAFGVLFGAIAVLAMSPRADPDVARAATALSAVPVDEPATVGPRHLPRLRPLSKRRRRPWLPHCRSNRPPQPPNRAKSRLGLISRASASTTRRRKRQPARILKPEAPAQSAPAQVVPASTPEITAAAKTEAPPKAAKKREKTAKTRQRERDREFADRERGRYADPRAAYASPYGSRYEAPPRRWGW